MQTRPSLSRNVFARAMALYALLSVAILVASVLVTAQAERVRLRESADHNADLLQSTLALPLWNVDDGLVRKIGTAFASTESFMALRIYDDRDRLIQDLGDIDSRGEKRVRDIIFQDEHIGRLELVMSDSAIARTAAERLLIFSIFLIVGTVIFFLSGRRIVARFLELSIAELSQASELFAKGSYGPVPAPPSYEEFQPLVSAIGRLGTIIREQIDELKNLTAQQETTIVELGKSLEERDDLLREVHHRVKNNLQILAAFVGEGKREAEVEEARAALSVMERRIQAMASLYDRCVDELDLRKVALADILESVSLDAAGAWPSRLPVDFDLDRSLSVPLAEALIAGIIVSDLVSRAASEAAKLPEAATDSGALAASGGAAVATAAEVRLKLILKRDGSGGASIGIECPWCANQSPGLSSELLDLAAREIGFHLSSGEASSWLRIRIPEPSLGKAGPGRV